ncbi:MAG: tRNA 2-selenouridine(34) synthase MnmH [Congregibacter sp.]
MTVIREDTADYAQLFLADAALMDTRAPVEFAKGAFPTAKNLPLMSDEERAAVGTCYKRQGQAAAIALGHELVAGELREARLQAWMDFVRANPDGYLYCFRGGLRSELVQQWLHDAGVDYPRVRGGYKAMRRFLIDNLDSQSAQASFWLVAGATGSGKTRVIKRAQGAIDLEGLARHRGSAFGRLLEPQPTQIDFENALSIELLKAAQTPGPVILEDEGKLIGRLSLPEALKDRMAVAPILRLEQSIDERVQVVFEDYIEDLGARFLTQEVDPERALDAHEERLFGDLARTRKRLGSERYTEVSQSMIAAFDHQRRSGDASRHREWIQRLLEEYYDPMYRYQLSQRAGKTLCVGDRETLLAFIAERRAHAD